MLQKLEGKTGTLLRLMGVVSAVAYILGFVVETLYLGTQGFFVLDLLKAQYIFSGFVLLCFLGCSVTIAVRWSAPHVRGLTERLKKQDYWTALRHLHASAVYFVLAGYSAACLLVALQSVAGRGSTLVRAADVLDFAPKVWGIILGYVVILLPAVIVGQLLMLVQTRMYKRVQREDGSNGQPRRARGWWWIQNEGLVLPLLVMVEAVLADGGLFLVDLLLPGVHRVALFIPAYALGILVALFSTGVYISVSDALTRDKVAAVFADGPPAMTTTRELSTTWITVSPMLLFGLVAGMWVYSGLVFPNLARSVGGGAPERVLLSTKNSDLKALIDAKDKHVYVVHQSDRYVLLQVRRGEEIIDRLYVPATSIEFYQLSHE